ncbi:transglycosylase [Coemansia aciculifera]|nr:transglycosylase [Coemansia aciculifera]
MGIFKLVTFLLAADFIGIVDSRAINFPATTASGLGGLSGPRSNYTAFAKALNTAQTSYTCKSEYIDFSDPSALSKFNVAWCPQNAYQTSNSVVWRLTAECGTTMIYPWDFQYGKLEARVRVSPGSGVVSTILLAGPDPADELDWEWVGKDTFTAQSMYFVKGQRVDPNAAFVHTPGDTPQDMAAGFHNYAIELNKDNVKWYIDDWLTRTLPKLDGVPFPSGASRARMGVWDGSQTSGWAGTVDWSRGPFTAEMQWFKFTPYC